jgi:2',3'-cyclic-nucleotide 2'-phosphodiesterase (5'-nucleotidase family)
MRYLWCILLLASCGEYQRYAEYQSIAMSDSIATEQDLDRLIAPYRDSLELTMNTVLVMNHEPLTRGIPESTLGNLIADLLLERALMEMPDSIRPLICLINIGGLRVDLPQGPITVGKVFELMPFENEIDIIKLSPEKVKEMLEYLNDVGGQPIAGFSISGKLGSGQQLQDADGRPIELKDHIYVVTSDYLAEGGDKMDFFKDPMARIRTGIKIRDAIIDDFRTLGLAEHELKASLDGRISVVRF